MTNLFSSTLFTLWDLRLSPRFCLLNATKSRPWCVSKIATWEHYSFTAQNYHRRAFLPQTRASRNPHRKKNRRIETNCQKDKTWRKLWIKNMIFVPLGWIVLEMYYFIRNRPLRDSTEVRNLNIFRTYDVQIFIFLHPRDEQVNSRKSGTIGEAETSVGKKR